MTHSSSARVAIVANGQFDPELAPALASYDWILAADGGLNHLDALKIKPHFIIGDFDSVSDELLNSYPESKLYRYPLDKDKSDVELAIEIALTLTDQEIHLYGATGLRVDHELSNLMLLRRYPRQLKVVTKHEVLFAFEGKLVLECQPKQTLSFMPIYGAAEGVSSKGLRWEINQATLDCHFLSLSNETVGDRFEVEVKRGLLLCCLYKLLI